LHIELICVIFIAENKQIWFFFKTVFCFTFSTWCRWKVQRNVRVFKYLAKQQREGEIEKKDCLHTGVPLTHCLTLIRPWLAPIRLRRSLVGGNLPQR